MSQTSSVFNTDPITPRRPGIQMDLGDINTFLSELLDLRFKARITKGQELVLIKGLKNHSRNIRGLPQFCGISNKIILSNEFLQNPISGPEDFNTVCLGVNSFILRH